MSFEWSDYLSLAHDLARLGATHSSREAESRSAISRAYYAAFCKTRNHLRDIEHEQLSTGPEAHREVQEKLTFSKNRTRKQIGQDLNRLRVNRNHADYDDQVFNLLATTTFSLELAEDILHDLMSL